MEIYNENKRSVRRSEGRRSSILKTVLSRDALTDIDPNQQPPIKSPVRKKIKRISRRVSFADTFTVKEFPRDSPHRPPVESPGSEENSPEVNFESEVETEDVQIGQPEGLEQLLTGTIQSYQPDPDQDVQELPFPQNLSDRSIQSINPNHTINDTQCMDFTCETDMVPMIGLDEPAPNDFGDECDVTKIDGSAFLQSMATKPSEILADKKLFVPEKQFCGSVSESKYTTAINTSLNKYVGHSTCLTTNSTIETEDIMSGLSVRQSSIKQRYPLGSIPDSVAKPSTASVPEETVNGVSTTEDIEDGKVDGRGFLNKLLNRLDDITQENKTVIFHTNNDMEETEVIFSGNTRNVYIPEDKTVVFGQHDNDMEQTEALGVIDLGTGSRRCDLVRDNQTVVFGNNDMEQTEVVGNIQVPNSTSSLEESKFANKTTIFSSENDMEQTEVVGNIQLNNTHSDLENTRNKTTIFTSQNDMEQTQALGWVKTQDQLQTVRKLSQQRVINDTESTVSTIIPVKSGITVAERTRHFSDDMDFTECHNGEIVFRMNMKNTSTLTTLNECQDKGINKEVSECIDIEITTNKVADSEDSQNVAINRDSQNVADNGDRRNVTDNGNSQNVIDIRDRQNIADNGDGQNVIDNGDRQKVADNGDRQNSVEGSLTNKTVLTNNNQTVNMEMTTCSGGLEKSAGKTFLETLSEKTKLFGREDTKSGMEFTECVGGLEKSVNATNVKEKTKNFSNDDITCGMEMTSCVGGFQNTEVLCKNSDQTKIYSTDDTSGGMELTCIGGSERTKSEPCKSVEKTSNMEMTECLPGPVINTDSENIVQNSKEISDIVSNSDKQSDNVTSSLSSLKCKLSSSRLNLSSIKAMEFRSQNIKSNDAAENQDRLCEASFLDISTNPSKSDKLTKEDIKVKIGKPVSDHAHTEIIEGPYSGLKRKLYGLENLVKKRFKHGRVSEGGSMGNMKLQFGVDTAVTAPIRITEMDGKNERKIGGQNTQQKEGEVEKKMDRQSAQEEKGIEQPNDADIETLENQPPIDVNKDVTDLGITDIQPPLDFLGTTANSDISKSSSDTSPDPDQCDQNRTLSSTRSDQNQTLNSTTTRTREYSILAEMAEKDPSLRNSINQSLYSEFAQEHKDGPLTVEKFCDFIRMPKIKWTSMAKIQTRRSSIFLPPIHLEDMKGALEAWAVYKTQMDVFSQHYGRACDRIEKNNAETEELEQIYVEKPPQMFTDVLKFTPEQCESLRDKVIALRKSVDKMGKKYWKETKYAANMEYYEKLKEKEDLLEKEVEEMNNASAKTEEMSEKLQSCLQHVEEEIGRLENAELPGEDEINEWNNLHQDLSNKELELQNREKTYKDYMKERDTLQQKVLLLEEEEGRLCIKESEEQEARQEEQEQLDKLKMEVEDVRSKLEPFSLEDKEIVDIDDTQDVFELKKQLQRHYDHIRSDCEWELEERDSNHIKFLFMDDTLMLHIHKEPSQKDKSNKILSAKLESMLIDETPPIVRMLHTLVHEIIDTNQLVMKYNTEADLNKLLHEVSCAVCDVRILYTEIDRLSLDYLMTVKDSQLIWEIWSLKSLRKITMATIFKPWNNSYVIHPLVEVVIGNIRPEDVMEQLKTVSPGIKYMSRLLGAIDLDVLQDKITETQQESL